MKRRIFGLISTGLATIMLLIGCGKNTVLPIPTPGQSVLPPSLSNYSTDEGKYPVTWNLESIYSSVDEWQADYDKAMKMLENYDKFRGHLDNAQTIREYFDFCYFTELTSIQSKLLMYAKLGNSLDPTDAVFKNLLAKMDAMTRDENERSSFAEPEIFEMSLEEREKIFSDPLFEGDEYWLEKYTDPEYEPFTENEELIMSTLSMGMGYAEDIFSILDSVELPYSSFKMPNGSVEVLDDETYSKIMGNPNYDDDLRIKVNQAYIARYEPFANTFAALLEENCSQHYAAALIDGYDTTLDAALDDYDLDSDVFDMLIDSAHDGLPEYQRYLQLHADAIGVEKQYPYNMGETASAFYPQRVNYDDAVDEVIDALGLLGDDYIKHFTDIVKSGHIDVYNNGTKTTGAFENQVSKDYYPWVLFNYAGYSDDISTIAHEMGHAVYDQYATENQPKCYNNPTVFTQEVASTTNELLYYNYKLQNAQDDDERLFYLEQSIYMFSSTFFTQMMYSEFEDYMYKVVESGNSLDAEDLGDKWMELLDLYRGGTIETFPETRYQWASIPHFYYNYYVYQYSADVAYAASIVQRLLSGEAGATEDYIAFLKLGGSMPPVELLSEAGVDPLDKKTYDEALEYFKSLVDEYEYLISQG
jgi:oligoendopeptidase F